VVNAAVSCSDSTSRAAHYGEKRLTVINSPQPAAAGLAQPIIQLLFNVACENPPMISALEYR